MEQEHHQFIALHHEKEEEVEVEDGALKTRKSLPHSKDTLVTEVVPPSSPSKEQEHHQFIALHHEQEEEEVEVEGGALKTRKSLPHSKDTLVTEVVPPSSPSENGVEHRNGVSSVVTDPDDFFVQKEEEVAEIGSVGEKNNNHFYHDRVDGGAAVGLGIVAEFVEAETNGEAITGVGFVAAASQNENSVYFDKEQDNEINGHNGFQNGDAATSVSPTNPGERDFDLHIDNLVTQNSPCSEVNNQCMKTLDDKVPSSAELPPLHNSPDTPVVSSHEETNLKESPELIEEIDQELEELDVEVVLAKQETHDLFCPNCNSCITKRVILRKRKRNIHSLASKSKRDKLDIGVSSNPVHSSTQESDRGVRADVTSEIVSVEAPDDNYHPVREPERDPDVFRCLSCFSIFIPSGKGFNLFRNFGGARKHETSQNATSMTSQNLQNPSTLPGSNTNWFISLFTSNKGKTATEQGDTSVEHSRTGSVEQHYSTSITSNMPTSAETGHPEGSFSDTALIKNVKATLDINQEHGGMSSQISSTVESVKVGAWTENDIKSHMGSGNEPLTDKNLLDSSIQNDLSSIQASTKSAGEVMNGVQSAIQDFIDFSSKDQLLTGNLETNEGEKKKNDPVDIKKTNNVAVTSSMSYSYEAVSKYETVQSVTSATSETLVNAGETAKVSVLNPYEGKPGFLAPPTIGSPILEQSQKDADGTPGYIKNSYSSFTQSSVQSSGSTVLASVVTSNKQTSGIDAIFPPKPDFTPIEKVQKDTNREISPSVKKESQGGDVIVVVEGEALASTTSQTAGNVPVDQSAIVPGSDTRVLIDEQPRDQTGERQQWEVLKSIVYGGLVESITSLGIVSSAVSSGAAPLNIIGLGLANLVGGLFILGHNLNDLKNNQSGVDQQQTNAQEDKYQELLGRRANFLLHAVVAVISFLIFGSVPLVIYGVLINKNYSSDIKLGIVAATSVVCIILLAVAKVYTRKPPKYYFKTTLYYVALALGASGISYIAGILIKELLEKFIHSESGFLINMPISGASMEPAWKSY